MNYTTWSGLMEYTRAKAGVVDDTARHIKAKQPSGANVLNPSWKMHTQALENRMKFTGTIRSLFWIYMMGWP
jgi:hypothetical protein